MEVDVKGVKVLIDEEDLELYNKYYWSITKLGYLQRKVRLNGKFKTFFFHRCILNLTNSNIITDHINRNRLDNRKCNLRTCTRKENNQNRTSIVNSSSKYLGVHLRKDNVKNKWRATCKKINLGSFLTEEEAALAYNKQAIIEYGEFASLNIIK